jgi:polyphosphate kinase
VAGGLLRREVEPVLSPLALDPARPFPKILNKSLNFAVVVEGEDGFGRNSGLAVVQAPRSLPRLIKLPDELGSRNFVFLGTIVEAFVSKLFAGMRMRGCYQFRVTRNSDLFVEQEEVDDLLRAVEGELASRRYGDAVRLETAHDCPDEILTYLLEQFALTEDDLYKVSGPVNLNRLMAVYDLIDRAELKYAPFAPSIPERLRWAAIFSHLRAGDVLLHHPFPRLRAGHDFIKQAASDPQVLAIKQTLYRAGSDSTIVGALADAAQAGKDVTVIIELRARFDEEANIELANKLQEAGAHVMYGVFGFKTHAKLVMVVRREEKGLRRYCHLGTGNYHAKTARLYTDYGLLTADEAIGEDVHEIFLQLTGLTRVPRLRKLLHAPFSLHQALLDKIEREARACARRQAGAHHCQAQCAHRAHHHSGAVPRLARRRGHRSDRARRLCCLRPGVPGSPSASRCAPSSAAFSSTRASTISRTPARARFTAAAPTGWTAICSGASRSRFPVESPKLQTRVADDLKSVSSPTTARLGSSAADGSYSRAAGRRSYLGADRLLLSLYDERVALMEPEHRLRGAVQTILRRKPASFR